MNVSTMVFAPEVREREVVIMADIRNRLSAVLGERRMSIKELERQSGVSYPALLELYHERSTRISFSVMASVCRTLGLNVGDLFYLVPNSEYPESESEKNSGDG